MKRIIVQWMNSRINLLKNSLNYGLDNLRTQKIAYKSSKVQLIGLLKNEFTFEKGLLPKK